jgi:hypothetical protein
MVFSFLLQQTFGALDTRSYKSATLVIRIYLNDCPSIHMSGRNKLMATEQIFTKFDDGELYQYMSNNSSFVSQTKIKDILYTDRIVYLIASRA